MGVGWREKGKEKKVMKFRKTISKVKIGVQHLQLEQSVYNGLGKNNQFDQSRPFFLARNQFLNIQRLSFFSPIFQTRKPSFASHFV